MDELINTLKFDASGLIPAVVQNIETNEVLMVAYMNADTIKQTLETGRATFWSRSRQEVWVKGDTSGNYMYVKEVRVDCDCDCLVVLVNPAGPACHTGNRSCFFRKIEDGKLVVFCNAVEDNPFMAGAFLGEGEGECVINVGVSGPGVVKCALEKVKGEDFGVVAETIKKTAFKITRMGQLVAQEASKRLNVPFGIVDLSLAPTPAVGDSVAYILEEMGLEMCGTHGTTAALALLNDAVKKGGIMASGYVGGLSGAFIPVSEDAGMIAAATDGVLTLEKLEAMTCVCSVGLDMIVIPGDTTAETISAIIADEAAIGMVNTKTTAVRVIPAPGKVEGDVVEFGGLLGTGPVMPVKKYSSAEFINRGGRIPAPLQSLKN